MIKDIMMNGTRKIPTPMAACNIIDRGIKEQQLSYIF
jgi:hypothetical protein